MLRFVITARLEFHRSPSLRDSPGPVVSAVQEFYASMVEDAIARGEIPAGTDAAAVVNMLLAMFLGMGFFAGYIVDQNNMPVIAKQLHQLLVHGLLDDRKTAVSAGHHATPFSARSRRRSRLHLAGFGGLITFPQVSSR